MKKVLVVYYSQTGQLTEIIKSVLSPMEKSQDVSLVFEEVRPKKNFHFPGPASSFVMFFPNHSWKFPANLNLLVLTRMVILI